MGLNTEGGVPLFISGTLRNAELRKTVIGRDVETREASLLGYRCALVPEGVLPVLVKDTDARAEGLLLCGLSAEEQARLDFYEAPFEYRPEPVLVEVDGAQVAAQVSRPPDGVYAASQDDWSLGAWQTGPGEMIRAAAIEIMRMYGDFTPEDVRFRMPMIQTRAQAWVNARHAAKPVRLRSGFTDCDVEIVSQEIVHSHFFSFEEVRLRHRKHAGGMSEEMQRGITMSADAVTVLPYDPKRDRVLLIEQFRAPMLMRGDTQPWAIEVIAGRLDPGETPESTAHREAMEEAGITLGVLHRIGNYYSAPGSNTEYLYSFIGECDLPDSAAGLGGLMGEHEDIRAMVVPFAELEEALTSGEVDQGPLLISTLWLQRERDRLRASL